MIETPVSFTVTNTNDGGEGSLRWAIERSNATIGRNIVRFNIRNDGRNVTEDVDSHLVGGDPEADVFVIRPLTALPALSDTTGGTWILGHSQAGTNADLSAFGPEVVLDGSRISDPSAAGLSISPHADGNRVEGLNIQGFSGDGISIVRSDGNVIAGNCIGTDATGTRARPNNRGILVSAGSQSNVIGSDASGTALESRVNVISGNRGPGIRIQRGSATDETRNNIIRANYIGTDAFGRVVDGMGNQASGIQFVSSGPGAGVYGNRIVENVIDGNTSGDVDAFGVPADANTVAGNADRTLTATFANGVLTVVGSQAADHILVYRNGQSVYVTEASLKVNLAVVDARALRQITVDARGGNDWVEVDSAITVAARLSGGAGDDKLLGGGGNDTLLGGAGSDEILGRGGNDLLSGEDGDDILIGGDGNDEIQGGAGNDYVLGGAGNDLLSGGDGDDQLYGEDGDDQIFAGAGSNMIDGGTGNDRLYGGSGADSILAGPGDDFVDAGAGDDQVLGEDGNDVIYAGFGNDMVDGGTGDDNLRGGDGDDMLGGSAGYDWIFGGNGADWIDGSDGNDTLLGGTGVDWLQGGAGNDHLEGGADRDELDGGPGRNVVIQGDDGTPSDPAIGSISQASFFGGVWDVVKSPFKWTLDRAFQIANRFKGWVESFDERVIRFGNGLWDGLTNWPWERGFWSGWGRTIVNALEISGLSEAWETAFDFIHPWQRAMTKVEISEARKVFGLSIDYDLVRIDTLSVMALIGRTHVTGNIINTANLSRDDIPIDVLIHELTHVWQYQHDGIIYIPEALDAQMTGGYEYFGVSNLQATMARGGGLRSFNREQQGEIVQDYYIRRKQIVDHPTDPRRSQWMDDLAVYAYFVAQASTRSQAELAGIAAPLT
ncbi:hypothetical protein P12x_006174 (plasmid) [Tundrisphaera lichenicola]|uniref:hypothetical protein n=1 Tax=Tundrisphaera lichenicola TaxID=2029860 RepID=UPI003EB7201C